MKLSNKDLARCEELMKIEFPRGSEKVNKYSREAGLYLAWQWDQSGRFDIIFEDYPEPTKR